MPKFNSATDVPHRKQAREELQRPQFLDSQAQTVKKTIKNRELVKM
ncbi:hypothetical protein LEMLEM_LOCUS10011 [Lemmus lemmus]